MHIHTQTLISIYTYLISTAQFPSVEVLITLPIISAQFRQQPSTSVVSPERGSHLRLRCICATPYFKGATLLLPCFCCCTGIQPSLYLSSKVCHLTLENTLNAFDPNLVSCSFVSVGTSDVN